MHIPEQSFYSAFLVVKQEKFVQALLLFVVHYKAQTKSEPYRSQCCSKVQWQTSWCLIEFTVLTDRQRKGQETKARRLTDGHPTKGGILLLWVKCRRCNALGLPLSGVSGLLCKRKISHIHLQMSKWTPTAWRCQHLFPIVSLYSRWKRCLLEWGWLNHPPGWGVEEGWMDREEGWISLHRSSVSNSCSP